MSIELLSAGAFGAKLLRPRQRAELARALHALRVFETTASDRDLWIRFGDEFPRWSASRIIVPIIVDRLRQCLLALAPTVEAAERKAARHALRSRIDELYIVLTTSDGPTREWRATRQSFRHQRQKPFVPKPRKTTKRRPVANDVGRAASAAERPTTP